MVAQRNHESGQIRVMSRAARWHTRVQRRIANLLERRGQSADAEVGLLIAPDETRVPDVAGVYDLTETVSLDELERR